EGGDEVPLLGVVEVRHDKPQREASADSPAPAAAAAMASISRSRPTNVGAPPGAAAMEAATCMGLPGIGSGADHAAELAPSMDHQGRAVGVAEHPLGDRAQQPAPDGRPAAAAH